MGWRMYSLATQDESHKFIQTKAMVQKRPARGVDRPPSRPAAEVDGSGVARQDERTDSVLRILDRIGCGYVVLDHANAVLSWNHAARTMLECCGETADARQIGSALRSLLPGISAQIRLGALSWVVIPCPGDRPVVMQDQFHKPGDETSVIVLLDRNVRSGPNPDTLQQMFGLTAAETQLALRLAHGDAPLDVARSRRLSRTTIRSQLAALFQKTETKRQAELVALLGRISVLP